MKIIRNRKVRQWLSNKLRWFVDTVYFTEEWEYPPRNTWRWKVYEVFNRIDDWADGFDEDLMDDIRASLEDIREGRVIEVEFSEREF